MESKTQAKRVNSKGKRAAKIFTIILITLLLIGIIVAGAYIYKLLNLETFYSGISIDGIDVAGMYRDEAISALQSKHQPTIDEVDIVLYLDDMKWTFDEGDIDVGMNIEEVVDEAYDIGRVGTVVERLKDIKGTSDKGIEFTTELTHNVDLILDRIAAIADEVYIEPVDATISFDPKNDPKFTFTDEKIGRGMSVDKALEDVVDMVGRWDFTPYEIPTEDILPEMTVEELKTWTSKVASFSTKRTGSAQRKHNIALSGGAFNGSRIDPGQVFSFNDATGPRNAKTGYKDAPVIKSGRELVLEPGGGNCQTSSTLYGALVRADVEVVERYPHSWPSDYVDPGLDATVNYPNVDLKVRNNKDSALFLHSYISNDRIVVDVYGKASEDYDKIGMASSVLSSTPAPEYKVVKDSTLLEGTEEIEYRSRPGYKVQSYRIYYKNGKEIKRVKEAHSSYPVITGKKRVGTKPKPVEAPPAPTEEEKPKENTEAAAEAEDEQE